MSFFSRIYDPMMARLEKLSLSEKRKSLLKLARGRVLEIGSGTGANLDKFPDGLDLVFSDPEPEMLKIIEKKMRSLNLCAGLSKTSAENIPYEDNSFDTVVSTLVLCSVTELSKALCEIRRILVPGGKLLFIEHIKGSKKRGRVQDFLTPSWSRFADGCRLNSQTMEEILKAGFILVKAESFNPAEKLWKINSWPVELFMPFVEGFAICNK